MGALCYLPEQALAEAPEIKDLHKIEEETEKILSEKPSEALETLFRSGGNSGGARPKYLIGLEGRSWLVKFRNHSDPENIGETEYRYSLAAKACGIRMPETRLFEGRYFGTERFDLRNGERIHMITAAGLWYLMSSPAIEMTMPRISPFCIATANGALLLHTTSPLLPDSMDNIPQQSMAGGLPCLPIW